MRSSLRRLAVLVGALVPLASASAQLIGPSPQLPLAGSAIPQFVQPLPTLDLQGSTIKTILPPVAAPGALPPASQQATLSMCEFQANILPPGTIAPGVQTSTWVWGYVPGGCPAPGTIADTYIGPVFVAQRGLPTEVTYVNNLGNSATTNVLAYKYSTDQTLHWADPVGGEKNACMEQVAMMGPPAFGSACAQNYAGPIPAVPHLHGGEVPPAIDGSPDSWFTSDGIYKGHKYYSKAVLGAPANSATYVYPNTQEAAPIWFHDHTLGATRLNVYAGLAGAYFVTDPAMTLPANLQPISEVVPLVIQDRMFDTTGQLFFQADSNGGILWATNADHPYWRPEFVGDTIVVNGKAWPFFNVQPKRYRFLVLNGSNARTYELGLINQATGLPGPTMWVIGNDGGYLDTPAAVDPTLGQKLVIMPGERYEVIVDFSAFPNTNFVLRNTGRTPYPRGAPPQGSTLGRVMQFRVGAAPAGFVDASYNPALGTPLRTGTQTIPRLANPLLGTANVVPSKVRELTLNEVMGMAANVINPVTGVLTAYPGGPLEILVNNTKWTGKAHMTPPRADFTPITAGGFTTYYSELPKEGETEMWEIVNLTADAHPIHLHLVQFQILNRQNFAKNTYTTAYNALFPAVPSIMGCLGAVFCPGYGPPLPYDTGATRLFGATPVPLVGGNPDVTPYIQGPVMPPRPEESGWKDTLTVPPGAVSRVLVRWAPTSAPLNATGAQLAFPFDPNMGGQFNYVWHCHIIDHEDNEMMRPTSVVAMPACPAAPALPTPGCVNRTVVQGVNF